MSLTSFALDVFLVGVVGPILLAAGVLYSKQRKKLIIDYWKQKKWFAFGLLLGAFCLVVVDLWRAEDLYDTFYYVLRFFINLLIISSLAYVLILYVERRANRENGPTVSD